MHIARDFITCYFCLYYSSMAKASGYLLSFNLFWQSLIWTYNKNKLYDHSDCWSRNMLNFDLLNHGLQLVSPHYFALYFPWKIFLMLYYITRANFMVWLSLLLEIFADMFIVFFCHPVLFVITVRLSLP